MIQFRRKQCLDCKMADFGRDETEIGVPCSICREPLCGRCVKEIKKVPEILEKDKDIIESKGRHLINLTCSYCRYFGCAKVSRGLLDDMNATPGANLGAFRLLNKYNEGAAELSFEVEVENKTPSAGVQRLDPSQATQSETVVVTD